MIAATATATEMQNNFGRYLNLVLNGQEIIVTKNGREVGRSFLGAALYLTSTGILHGDIELDEAKSERLAEKYGVTD